MLFGEYRQQFVDPASFLIPQNHISDLAISIARQLSNIIDWLLESLEQVNDLKAVKESDRLS